MRGKPINDDDVPWDEVHLNFSVEHFRESR